MSGRTHRSPVGLGSERGCSMVDVQDSFGREIGLELFMTALAHVYQRIAGAAQSHLVLGIDRALYRPASRNLPAHSCHAGEVTQPRSACPVPPSETSVA